MNVCKISGPIERLTLLTCLLLYACVPSGCHFGSSTRPVIKIGLAAPFEGLDRRLGYQALQGVKMALAQRNLAGGVAGYMVELVALNDSGEPDEAQRQAREFAADPAVVGVIASWDSRVAPTALPAYRQAGLAVVLSWSVPPELADLDDGVVLIAADTHQVAQRLAQMVSVGRFERVAIVGDQTAARPYLELSGARATRVAPPDVPNDEVVREWAVHLVLSRVRPPDAVVLATDGVQAGALIVALDGAGWQGWLFGATDVDSTQLVDVAGEPAEGLVFAAPAPIGRDIVQTAEATGDIPLSEMGSRAVLAYDATQVLLSAIESASQAGGGPTRQGVISALRAVHVHGLTGEIALDATGRRTDAPVWLYRIAHGSPVLIGG
jgi:branched-chain amino acid transport system substrate-binding protein